MMAGFTVEKSSDSKTWFRCPFCGGPANIKPKREPDQFGGKWNVGCIQCQDGTPKTISRDSGERTRYLHLGRQYLARLSEHYGVRPIELLRRADEIIEPDVIERAYTTPTFKGETPHEHITRSSRALLKNSRPLSYLTEQRGLTLEVIKRERLGLHGQTWLFLPFFNAIGAFTAYKVRRARAGHHPFCPDGSGNWGWTLYPHPIGAGPLLICGGELDALCALSHGIQACSVPLGVQTWRREWANIVRHRAVTVAFDVGEEREADFVAQQLELHAPRVSLLDLRRYGFTDKGSDVSDYLNNGGDPAALLKGAQ